MPELQSLPRLKARARPRAPVFQAFVACAIVVLQVLGSLHFWLVPHAFSAALGGVVHVQAQGSAEAPTAVAAPKRVPPSNEHAYRSGSLTCVSDVCPLANAPAGTPLFAQAEVGTELAFGAEAPLLPPCVPPALTARVFESAPKTSPPS